MSDLVKVSAKFGLPNPETSKQLKWEEETLFCWYFSKGNLWPAYYEDAVELDLNVECFAPQFHEIWAKLPDTIEGKKDTLEKTLAFDAVCYLGENPITIAYHNEIQNNNLAEAAAQLYLQLKTAGKL